MNLSMHYFFFEEHIQDINQNEASSKEDIFPDEMLKIKRQEDTKAASKYTARIVFKIRIRIGIIYMRVQSITPTEPSVASIN